MSKRPQTTLCIGRILLSVIFLMSGVHKLTAWQSTAGRMAEQGMVAVHLFLAGAVILELGGGLSLLLGFRTKLGAVALIVFLIPTTVIFHDFWSHSGSEQQLQMIHFMKNIAILGGLFMTAGAGAGCCSVDHRRSTRSHQTAVDEKRVQTEIKHAAATNRGESHGVSH